MDKDSLEWVLVALVIQALNLIKLANRANEMVIVWRAKKLIVRGKAIVLWADLARNMLQLLLSSIFSPWPSIIGAVYWLADASLMCYMLWSPKFQKVQLRDVVRQ